MNLTLNVGALLSDNNRTRLIMNDLEVVVDETCANENKKTLWNRYLNSVRIALRLLRKRKKCGHNEINDFQIHNDLFAQDWVESRGHSGITN